MGVLRLCLSGTLALRVTLPRHPVLGKARPRSNSNYFSSGLYPNTLRPYPYLVIAHLLDMHRFRRPVVTPLGKYPLQVSLDMVQPPLKVTTVRTLVNASLRHHKCVMEMACLWALGKGHHQQGTKRGPLPRCNPNSSSPSNSCSNHIPARVGDSNLNSPFSIFPLFLLWVFGAFSTCLE